MKLIHACLTLFLCLVFAVAPASASGAAGGPVVLDDHRSGVSLAETGQLMWLPDTSGAFTLNDVQTADLAARFVPTPPFRHSAAQAHVAHWFRIELEQRASTGDWVLATHTTGLKDVRFFGPFNAAGQALAPPVHTGLSQPFASRPLGSERYVVRLQPPEAGPYTVYARLVGDTAPILGLSVWDTAEYLQWRQHKRLFDGICYGILLALFIYNLVLTGIFRDATYGFYVGQCAFALLTLASYNGHAAHYLWGAWPWWQERANVVLPGLWVLSGAFFARSFLGTRAAPTLDRLLQAMAALAVLASALGLAGRFGAAQALTEGAASTGALAAVAAAIIILRRGFRPARWYLGGQAVLFLSVLGVVLVNWQLIDAPFLLANGLQIGVAAEMVVFAIALSRRISGMRDTQIELRLHAAHLAEAAATDPLTAVANRAGLAQGAARVLASGGGHALMLLDLDRFKPVNDQFGHDAGDAVLRAVASRLQARARSGDIVARLGGDEFVLLLAGDAPDERLAALARRLCAEVREPVNFQGHVLTVGVSIGIARSPRDGRTLTELLRSADQAMYRAKQAGTGHALYGSAAMA